MPPRRSGRRTNDHAQLLPAQPRSAGRELYNIQEIREIILDQLDGDSLANFMAVEKKSQYDVATRLYRRMDYETVRRMATGNARQRMCLAQVKIIDADQITLTQSVQRALGLEYHFSGDGKKARLEENLGQYQPDLIRVLLPPLRKKCINLEKVHFGRYSYFGDSSWSLYLHPAPPRAVGGPFEDEVDPGGDIALVRTYVAHLHNVPFTGLEIFVSPGPTYSGTIFFDLIFEEADPDVGPPLYAEWLQSLKDCRYYGFLVAAIDFADLPVTFEHLCCLYQRQLEVGNADRLARITALALQWSSMADFQLFANVASKNLEVLKLATGHWDDFNLSFTDVPVLVETIRTHLPNLTTLWVSMKGIETAEADCAAFLTPESLDEGGTITQLHIYTTVHTTPLFNIIRALSPITASECEIDVYSPPHIPWPEPTRSYIWKQADQEGYLSYLRRRSPESKAILSIIDFSTLGIDLAGPPTQVYKLKYGPDGAPYSLGRSITEKWSDAAQEAVQSAEDTLFPDLEAALAEYTEAAEMCQKNAATATKEEKLADMKRMLAALEKVTAVSQPLRELASKNDRKADAVRQYLQEMRETLEMARVGGE